MRGTRDRRRSEFEGAFHTGEISHYGYSEAGAETDADFHAVASGSAYGEVYASAYEKTCDDAYDGSYKKAYYCAYTGAYNDSYGASACLPRRELHGGRSVRLRRDRTGAWAQLQ